MFVSVTAELVTFHNVEHVLFIDHQFQTQNFKKISNSSENHQST